MPAGSAAESVPRTSQNISSGTERLDLFQALHGAFAIRDVQDLMAYPFFSLAKSRRTTPIEFRAGAVSIRVEAGEHGLATIWDADLLIWAASQVVEARDRGLTPSRGLTATPYEILSFIGRGVSARDYDRLRRAFDRLQSTSVLTSIRQPNGTRRHRFSWVNEWTERADRDGRPRGLDVVLPDWLYAALLDDALVQTIDRAYFGLTGGLERWLYRTVRKHAGLQRAGWIVDLAHLHRKSGSLSPPKHFVHDLRAVVRAGRLPGYRVAIEQGRHGPRLTAVAVLQADATERSRSSSAPVDKL